MSDIIIYAECTDCGGSEEIQDISKARTFVCDECLSEAERCLD